MIRAALIILVASVTAWFSWSGFYASDDIGYYDAAKGWLSEGAYVPTSFWQIRSTTAWPISASIALLGDTEFNVVLPSVLYLIALLLLTYRQLALVIPANHAFVATATLATLPVLTINAGWPSADMPQIFWGAVAFWCLVAATRDSSVRPVLLISAGAGIGLAFMGRETVSAMILFIGLLFLVGYRIPRWAYWLTGVGFIAVIGGEALYFWIVTGDPMHRFTILAEGFGSATDRQQDVPPFTIDSAGTLRIWWPIDSLVAMFTKHEFGITNWILLPLLVGLTAEFVRRRRRGEEVPEWQDQAQLALLLGAIWVAFNMVVLIRIAILARYHLPPVYFLFVAGAIWASRVLWPRRKLAITLAMAAMISINLAAVAITDLNSRAGERLLAKYMGTAEGRIRTDPFTAFRSRWYVQWAGQDFARIEAGPPQAGDLFFYNRTNAAQPNRLLPAAELARYRPQPGWQPVWTWRSDITEIGKLLSAIGVSSLVPGFARGKLLEPRHEVIVYRIPASS